jgi:N-methylhydantoinase A/oxoprolinase/acetone carboxylase beta subunit
MVSPRLSIAAFPAFISNDLGVLSLATARPFSQERVIETLAREIKTKQLGISTAHLLQQENHDIEEKNSTILNAYFFHVLG